MKSFSIIAACTFCVTVTISQGAAAEQPSPVGKTIDDFQLSDYLGSAHQLSDWHDKKAVAIVFLGAECPLARLYAGRLEELAKRYGPRGVQFIGIDANQQDSLEKISQFARAEKIDFPLLKDPASKVADQFGALRTPEAFLLDPNRAVKYWGAIDDQYGVGVVRPKAKKQYLADALDELLAGKPISNPEAQAVGCIIGRVNRKAPTGGVTYSKQIARIFNAHCVECHRPGQVAPFSLTSYDEASAWAETIREVMQAGRMPPWHADPQYGRFRNDARLSDEDKRLVYAWIENGVPEGDRRQLPEAPKFIEGWRIPQPDLVVRMPEAFKVPATGTVPYQYFTVDPGFKEDVWIRAAEGRPGNRAVVHHMIVFYLATGEQQRPEIALTNAVASFVPGMPAHSGPETYGRRIPAGSKLIFQMHYTPNGSEQIDQSEAGFVITDPKKVQTEVTQAAALTWKFQIPPGDADYPVTSRYHFTEDVELYTLVPHMHWRGKSFRFTAVYPDQHEEVLLDVPHYDFNWQNAYMLAAPKRCLAEPI